MFPPCSFSYLARFSSSQHPSSSITALNDTSHEHGAAEDDRVASSNSDSDSSSRTSHPTTDEDSDQASDQGDIDGSNAYSDNEQDDESGSKLILDDRMTDDQATDVTREHTMTDASNKCRMPRASEALDDVNGMSTHFAVGESSVTVGLSKPDSGGAAHKRWPHSSDEGHG